MSLYTYYAYVDFPGEKPLRTTIGVHATKGYTDSQGLFVAPQYDELIPNQEGVFKLAVEHENHVKRTALLKQVAEKLKRRNENRDRLVGPFDTVEECLIARYNARPKSAEEALATEKEQSTRLSSENAELREKLKAFENAKKSPKAKAKSAKISIGAETSED
jgi:hypothetical protein